MPYGDLGDAPNVIVDGFPTPSTRLVLSHWPGSPTPSSVADDLSAQITFRALDHPDWFDGLEVVSNNHFDQDGLVSALALVDPAAALARKEQLIDVARAGDFGTFADRNSARVAMVLAAFSTVERSPLGHEFFSGDADPVGALYLELLPKLTEIVDRPDAVRELWAEEDELLGKSIDDLEAGTVTIQERTDIDLAIVTVPEGMKTARTTRFTQTWEATVHPMAVNNATDRFRVLLVQGHRYRLELRYESWVMFRSRPVQHRPDLRPFALHLNAMEGSGTIWTADPPGALTPMLGTADCESRLTPTDLIDELDQFLRSAPPAWDPERARS